MFQIEPVLWLQSLESPGVTWVMSTVSLLGYTPVYATLLIVLIFGVRLKQGIFVFLALLICGILTDGLKRGIKMPRPGDIDIRVIEPGKTNVPPIVDEGGAKGFWALPAPEAMAAAKIQTGRSYGFPSGHVSAATAFLLGLAFFFRSKRVLVFSVCWIILMALSRMYLGRHFIADVLGGMGVGVFAVAVAAFLVRPLNIEDSKELNSMALLRWTLFVIPLVALAPFIEIFDKENIGRLLGLFVTFAVLFHVGFPSDEGKVWKRVARVLLAIVASLILVPLSDLLIESMDLDDNSFGMLGAVFLITFVPLYSTVFIARRLKLYEST